MAYQQDIEDSADALDKALKSIEAAIGIMPIQLRFEKTELRRAKLIIGNVRWKLKPGPGSPELVEGSKGQDGA